MNIPSLYTYSDYIDFLNALVKANKEQRGFQTQLCQKLGCQPATFSRALNNTLELTRDQVANLCQVLMLSDLEVEYLLGIYDLKLSSSPYLRQRSQEKVKKLKANATKISAQLKEVSEPLDLMVAFEYYSSWSYSAVHMLLMIPEYRSFEKIKNRLKIEEEELLVILNKLVEWGLAKKTKSGFEASEKSLHLDKNHPVSNQDHINWRIKAIDDIQKKKESSLHYSAVFSMSRGDFEVLKKTLVDDIKKHRKLITASASEELCVCNIDFFQP
jgi:hypothetical protein